MAIRKASRQYNSDYMSRLCDDELEQLEERLTALYAETKVEVLKEYSAFIDKYKDDYLEMTAKLDAGEITQSEFTRWTNNKILKDTLYKETVKSLTDILVNSDIAAMALISDELPYIIAESYNFVQSLGWAAADEAGLSVGTFQIYNAETVQAILKKNPDILPVVDIPEDQKWNKTKINNEITHGIIKGESIPKIADRLQSVTNMDENAATRNARTAMTGAENLGRNESFHNLKKKGIPVRMQWSATYDDRTRDTHLMLDGTFQNEDGYFGLGILVTPIEYPGDPAGDPEEIYNCFVGDTNVCTDSDVIRTYKHEYQGKLVTVKTAGGVAFTCTLNHPILTMKGWVAVESLNNGDDIIVTFRKNKVIFRRDPNIQHTFASFDALHKFFDEIGSKRTCTLGVNFHGDIPTSEVEIITQKRFLRNNSNTGRCKFIDKFLLIFTDKTFLSNSSFMKHLRSIRFATLRFICKRSKSLAFFFAGLRHSQIHRLRPIALLDAGFIEPLCDGISGSVKFLSESIDGFSGFVFSDKIVSIDINEGHTHVYNLQSENGYYFVNSIISQKRKNYNDIVAVAHNCRCRASIKIEGIDHSQYENLYAKFMTQNYPEEYEYQKAKDKEKGRTEAREKAKQRKEDLRKQYNTLYDSLKKAGID